jgi:hypothetical protein
MIMILGEILKIKKAYGNIIKISPRLLSFRVHN